MRHLLMTVIGARPQFIKAALVSAKIRETASEILVHTGQHYDSDMSDIFFRELGIPSPDIHLGISQGTHASQTGNMIIALEKVMVEKKPEIVIVYGDTNSTIAAALAAAKLNIPIAHIEAGMRSFDRSMPEEINRVVTDHCSSILLCPNKESIELLAKEGISHGVHLSGDIMYDVMQKMLPVASQVRSEFPEVYVLATIHRQSNTDDPQRLKDIFQALSEYGGEIVLPLHPRTRKKLEEFKIAPSSNVRLIPPRGYVEMLSLEMHARIIATDSGGVQKEAYWLGKPCITLRDTTEWNETVSDGWNILAGWDMQKIATALKEFRPTGQRRHLPEKGSDQRIADILMRYLDEA